MHAHKKLDKLDNMNAQAAWKELVGNKQQMDEDTFSVFITKTLELAEDNILQFYILTIGMKTPKLGHIRFQHFQNLFKFMGACKTIKDLKKLIPRMEKELLNPNVFKQMYRSLFDAFLTKTISMDFQFAEALWAILLVKDFVYLKSFQKYLQHLDNKKPTKCHKDLWNMLYEFAMVVKNIGKDYSQSDAWPVFLDNFVEWMKENQMV